MVMDGDREFIQIVDAALAEAAQKSGAWLVCRPGCCQCCLGAFAITQLDAARLRNGLKELETGDPVRAARVRQRARDAVDRERPCGLLHLQRNRSLSHRQANADASCQEIGEGTSRGG